MANIVRYPKELVVGSTTDYIEFKTIKRNYNAPAAQGNVATIFKRESGYNDFPMGSTGSILLPMPQKVSEANSQSYSHTTLGPEVQSALTGGGAMGSAFEGNTLDLADILIRLAENKALDFTAEMLNKLGGTNLSRNAVLSATSGVIYNPMMEVLYDGPRFRTFNYQFLLFAKSEDDAKNIYKIVRFFQQASAPAQNGTPKDTGNLTTALLQSTTVNNVTGTANALGSALTGNISQGISSITGTIVGSLGGLATAGAVGTGTIFSGDDRFISNPPHMLITYKRGSDDHPYILPPQPCVIDNVQIDYTPGGSYTMLNNYSSTAQATTVSTLVTLTLTETKITYQDYYQ